MKQTIRQVFERYSGGTKSILVCIHLQGRKYFDDILLEFSALAHAANAQILQLITGKREVPTARYFVGQGKVEEIAACIKEKKAELVIFNHNLTPAQERNLEEKLQCRVLDRTGLILDIFAQRAQTYEGKLQVELAQLEHIKTRLVRGWSHLERQKGGIGLRGPGETQLETDRRLIAGKIRNIHKQLDKVLKRRAQGRKARHKANVFTVALVGYTNAGKSTLFNRLVNGEVYAAEQLFATLDPTARRFKIAGVGNVILIDTVGFIQDLPHELVAAFRATLEEVSQADLLLHVIDVSKSNKQQDILAVNTVLKEIGAEDIPQIEVYNKIDLFTQHPDVKVTQGEGNNVRVSAQTGEGLQKLQTLIFKTLAEEIKEYEVILSQDEQKLRAQLYALDVVLYERITEENNYVLGLRMSTVDYYKFFGEKQHDNH